MLLKVPWFVDPAPANLANTAEGWFIITEGPNKESLDELLEGPSCDE